MRVLPAAWVNDAAVAFASVRMDPLVIVRVLAPPPLKSTRPFGANRSELMVFAASRTGTGLATPGLARKFAVAARLVGAAF